MKNIIILSAAILFLLISCSKPDISGTSSYTFTNNTSAPVTLSLYGTEEDYNTEQHVMSSQRLQPGGHVTMPLEALRTYWIDWYSDGYSFSNWLCGNAISQGSRAAAPSPELTTADRDDALSITTYPRDTMRSILLSSNGATSTWQLDVDNMPYYNGIHTFVFHKNFTGTYTYARTGGDTVVKPFMYVVDITSNVFMPVCGDMTVRLYPPGDERNMIAELGTMFDIYHSQRVGRDTLMVSLFNGSQWEPARRL